MWIRKFFSVFFITFIFFIVKGCGVDSENFIAMEENDNVNLISGYVYMIDEPVPNVTVYIKFPDGTISTETVTDENGYFEINLSEDILNKIYPKIPEGAEDSINTLLIMAEKNGRFLRSAISHNINDIGTVYITSDTEAFAEFLESIGKFSENNLLQFITDELQNGQIKKTSEYVKFIKSLREDIKAYLNGGKKPTPKYIFEKALLNIDKSILVEVADDNFLLPIRNVIAGGDIILPEDAVVSSEDITITSKGNGRYTLGNGYDSDRIVYLKIQRGNVFNLIRINIKEKRVFQVGKKTVDPKKGAVLGDDLTKIIIPPFAVDKVQEIIVSKVESEGETIDGKPILNLEPNGLKFNVPITIKINYANLGIDNPYTIQWIYGNSEEGYEEADIVGIDNEKKLIYLSIDHFSDLLIKKKNDQEFLDLGPNFIVHIPRRNTIAYLVSRANNAKLLQKNITTIIGNRLFLGDSLNNRVKEPYTGWLGGGECVQTVYTISALLYNGLPPNYIDGTRVSNARYMFDFLEKLIKNEDTKVIEKYFRTRYEDIKPGDIVYFYGFRWPGHTAMAVKKGILFQSNILGYLSKNKFQEVSYKKAEVEGGLRISFPDEDPFSSIKKRFNKDFFALKFDLKLNKYLLKKCAPCYIVLRKEAFENTISNEKTKKYHVIYWTNKTNGPIEGWFSYEELRKNFDWNKFDTENPMNYAMDIYRNGRRYCSKKDNGMNHGYDKCRKENPTLQDFLDLADSKWENINERKFAYKVVDESYEEKPYLYYLVSEIGDGIKKIKEDKYKYIPDLLPVAPLKVYISKDKSNNQIQNNEDALYEIYAEKSNYLTFVNPINTKIKKYLVMYPTFENKKYLKREEIEQLLNKRRSGEINYLGGYTIINGVTYKLYGDWNIVKEFSNKQIIEGLTSKIIKDVKGTSLVLNKNPSIKLKNSLLYDVPLYRFESNGVVSQNFIAQDSAGAYVISPKLQRILFSPIVIDDYYISWGKRNSNHDIPIGFWNSYGYNLEYKGRYISDIPLEPKKIYSSAEAVNGYFMTLGNGESAEWHFALAGPHAILLNVPTAKKEDIQNARYTLYLNGQEIELQPAETMFNLDNSAFKNWIYLKSKDGKITFNLTGNDYLKVEAQSGVVLVDAIRLEDDISKIKSERLIRIQGNAVLDDPYDHVKYYNFLKICNISNKNCIKTTTQYGAGFVVDFPRTLEQSITLELKYIPTLKNITNSEMLIKYKPIIQTITVNPDDDIKILPKVVLQPYKVKSSIKLHVINALNGLDIKNAKVAVKYGINNENGSIAYDGITDANGYFEITDIPYGQYTILISKDGFFPTTLNFKVDEESSEVYDFALSPIVPENEIRIVLTWGENPLDLDSHLIKTKDGQVQYHVYYGNKKPTDESDLDYDDTNSFGPETITIYNLDPDATYKYYVHDYSNEDNPRDEQLSNSGATVKIYWNNDMYTFYVPSGIGNAWKVFEIVNGILIPCTENCLFGVNGPTDSLIGTRANISRSKDRKLLKNLPEK